MGFPSSSPSTLHKKRKKNNPSVGIIHFVLHLVFRGMAALRRKVTIVGDNHRGKMCLLFSSGTASQVLQAKSVWHVCHWHRRKWEGDGTNSLRCGRKEWIQLLKSPLSVLQGHWCYFNVLLCGQAWLTAEHPWFWGSRNQTVLPCCSCYSGGYQDRTIGWWSY